MRFLIRCDMEGLTGVTTYDEVTPGNPLYEAGRDLLMHDLLAVIDGLSPAEVVLYDEHHAGRNVRIDRLPANVRAIVGKPPYRADWPGGLGPGIDAMLMVGFHSMAGTPGGTLAHSYEHDIEAIEINGRRVGEVGVESALAGELDIPMILYAGDSAGAVEAQALIGGLTCVVTKESLGETAADCLAASATGELLRRAAMALRRPVGWPAPLKLGQPVELRITLADTPYRAALHKVHPDIMASETTAILEFNSLAAAWAQYWECKLAAHAALARG